MMADPVAAARESVVDDGSVRAEVRDILGRFSVRQVGMREVVGVLARNRLLVPLLEVDADQLEGDDADPCAGQDRAVAAVSLRVEDGSLGLAFTGMEALRAWRTEARPMPFPATEVAAALVQEGAVGLIVDPAGPAPCRLPPLAVARLAAGGTWPEPWDDPAVRQSVAAELAPVVASGEVQVRLAAPRGGEPGPAEPAEGVFGPRDRLAEAPASAGGGTAVGLVVEIRFRADLPAEVASERAGVIAERLAGSELLRQAFDGVLAVRIL